MAYRVYVTDVLRVMNENIAKIAGGSVLKMRYMDILKPQKEKHIEDKSAQEIVDDIVNRAGITVVKNNESDGLIRQD